MLEVAKPLVAEGFAVHWLHPKSKRPAMGNDWADHPKASFEELKKRYRKGMNIGVRLGEISKVSGHYLHVLDLDIRDESYLEEAMTALREMFPDFEEYPRVKSGSGGLSRHYYFLTDQPFRSRKLAHSSGKYTDEKNVRHWHWEIELFGSGKQVAMPPSIHPDTGKPYTWEIPFEFDMLDLGIGPFVPADKMPSGLIVAEATDDGDDDDDLAALLAMVNSPPRGLSLDEIRDVLEALPLEEWCEDRDGWYQAGMAVHHETSNSPEGFELWCEWSAQSSKYDEANAAKVWESFNDPASMPRDVKPLTMGTLMKVVQDEGLDFVQCQNRLQQASKYREALRIAAAYDLTNTEIDTILPRLVELAKQDGRVANKSSLRKDLNKARKDYKRENDVSQRKGLEDWLADEVLRVFFNSGRHIRRFSKAFWVYDKGVWRMIESEVVGNRVYQLVSQISSSDEAGARALQLVLSESGRNDTTNALANSVLGLIEKKCATDMTEDPMGLRRADIPSVMNCLNGELWFRNGKVAWKDHKPENLLTQQLTADYDPEAECPEWDAALQRIFRDYEDRDDVIRHLEEVMGYTLQGTRSLAAWVMLYGTGSNGKSFVAQVLQALMGPSSCSSMSLADFGDGKSSHAESGLVGRLMLLDDDFKYNAPLPDDVLKKISETKMLTANPKYAGQFNFVCRLTPWVLTNHWPKTGDLSWGLVRRAQVFHFCSRIGPEEADPELLNRVLRNEREGILAKLVEAWSRLQKRGRFVEPESCTVALNTWLGQRNSLATFISDHLVITKKEEDRCEGQDIFDAYKNWSMKEGVPTHWGRNTFYSQIAAMDGIRKQKTMHGVVFYGMWLRQDASDFDDLEGFDDVLELI